MATLEGFKDLKLLLSQRFAITCRMEQLQVHCYMHATQQIVATVAAVAGSALLRRRLSSHRNKVPQTQETVPGIMFALVDYL